MYNFPIAQAAPLVNALLQTLLLLFCPLVIAVLLGGALGVLLFFRRHPLFAKNPKHAFASVKLAPYLRSTAYLGLLPLLFLLLRQIPGIAESTAVILLLSLGAAVYMTVHVFGSFHALDASTLEMALSSGLLNLSILRRVLFPLARNRLLRTLCDTTLFLLAMGTVSGCVSGIGLAGLAIRSGLPDLGSLTWIWCLLLLLPLFLLAGGLSARFAKKA